MYSDLLGVCDYKVASATEEDSRSSHSNSITHPHKNSIVYMDNILELPMLEKEQDMYYYELT